MTYRGIRSALAIATGTALAIGCAGSDGGDATLPVEATSPIDTSPSVETTVLVDTSAPADTTTTTTTAPAVTTAPPETTAPVDTTAPSESVAPVEPAVPAESLPLENEERSESGGVIEAGLRAIPLVGYSLALEAGGLGPQLVVGDLVAVADAGGFAAPEPGSDLDPAVFNWLIDLQRSRADGEARLTLALPPLLTQTSTIEGVSDELGLDVGAIERFAWLGASPFEMLVLEGELEVSAQLDDLGGGILSFGTGEDYQIDLDVAGVIDQLGQPTRIGTADRSVVLSRSSEVVRSWLAGDESLASVPDYLAAAQALDAAGALGAIFSESSFDQIPEFGGPELVEAVQDGTVITERFELVAIGMTINDGQVGNAVSYVFDSESSAGAAVEGIRTVWTDSDVLFERVSRIDELVELTSIEAVGNVVTVQLVSAAGRDTSALISLLAQGDLQFLHS